MKRVAKNEGTVATFVWDYQEKMELLQYFWDCAVELDPTRSKLHESVRFSDFNAEYINQLFIAAELPEAIMSQIEIEMQFQSFEDYWLPFLGGQGPASSYVQSLDDAHKTRLSEMLKERLPVRQDGTISLVARAWAAKCAIGV